MTAALSPAELATLVEVARESVRHAVLERRSWHPDPAEYEHMKNAYRLDRGLSAPDVLETLPGTRWDEERGLDAHSYIIPGAGGLGEVLNNSWC